MNVTARKIDDLQTIAQSDRAAVLMNPLRLRILSLAQAPTSSTELGRQLGLSRQKVNYHVKELMNAEFLQEAGQIRKRNMIEQRYVATAMAYVISPQVLGPVAAGISSVEDKFSASYLIALGSQLQSDLTRACAEAAEQNKRISTLSVLADIRFESVEQREQFARELQKAVTDVIGKYSSPDKRPDGSDGSGRPHRFMLGCYPVPPNKKSNPRKDDGDGP